MSADRKHYPYIIVSNEHDENPRAVSFYEALWKGLPRRVVRIFVINSAGEVYLQKRSHLVEISPGTLDISAAGHVDEGKTYEEAARQELFEELGIEAGVLEELDKVYVAAQMQGRETPVWEKIFKISYSGPIVPQEAWEVSGGQWMTPEEIDEKLSLQPDQFSSTFIEDWQRSRAILFS